MDSNSSATATLSTENPLSSSQLLTSSISSLSRSTSSRHASSQITKIYRQASTLFLTRRLPESLSTLLPVITPSTPDENGLLSEINGLAPVSTASRSTRIKVWSLYLTILNAILELDPDEGKQAFGSQEWRACVTKVRDGRVWEEVVKNGYGGLEGSVDPDVVINLSTILLSHSPTQTVNQQRLENYLAASHNPSMDISTRLENIGSPLRRRPGSSMKNRGTDTPRDLTTRIRILELFTLHVLLQNNEWDYAQEFITNSSDLDEERREAFLQALQQLHDEYLANERVTSEAQLRREEQLQKDMEEVRQRRLENEERERQRGLLERGSGKREEGDNDYGLEATKPNHDHRSRSKTKSTRSAASSSTAPKSSRNSINNNTYGPGSSSSTHISPRPKPSSRTYSQRASALISNFQKILGSISVSLQTNPMHLFRTLAFVIGLIVVFGQRDVRERMRRLVGRGWGKVVQTAGMGVKVSYI